MTVLKIATYNTWNCQGCFDSRIPAMREGLRALDADVVLLQEVFAEAPSGFDLAQDLAAALDMTHIYAPARKKLRKCADRPVLCHSGLAVLARGHIKSHAIFPLPHDERDGERLGLVARVETHGCDVVLGNVHLTHLPGENGLRAMQLTTLAQRLANERNADLLVVGGDMNLVSGHRVLQNFVASSAFQSVGYGIDKPPASTLNPINGSAVASGVIDHLFVKGERLPVRAAQAQVVLDEPNEDGVFPSDHKAVVVRVALGGGALS